MHKYIDIKYIKQLDLSYNYFMAQRMPLRILSNLIVILT